MDKEKFYKSGLLEMYVLGLASESESQEVEELMRHHPDVRHELEEMRKALEQYALDHAIPPPEGLKDNILHRLDETDETAKREPENGASPTEKSLGRFPWLPILAIALLATMGTYFFWGKRSAEQELKKSRTAYAQLQENCEEEKALLRRSQEAIAFLSQQSTAPVILRGNTKAPGAFATVYLNKVENRALLSISGMPEPPVGMQYQLWADVNGEMINMGLVQSDDGDLVEMTYIPEAESVNLTLEPMGGSEHPTVSRLLANAAVTI